MEQVKITKLVHGGQGMGTMPDGRIVFVWNTLPGETVAVRIIKSKKDYAEGIAEEIIVASPDRIEPLEPASYLATSPWQMMNFAAENRHKKDILAEAFQREHVLIPEFKFTAGGEQLGYRSKMEYGFWGDDQGISLAHFVRGSHGKNKVEGSVLARTALNDAAKDVMAEINTFQMRAGDIKSLLLRCDQNGNTVAALFVKREDFIRIKKPKSLQGMVVYYSNPKSPASVPTKLLYALGERTLQDKVLDTPIKYDVLSFFQVNLPIFNVAMQTIKQWVKAAPLIDMYSGVGAIGIPLKTPRTLIELDAVNCEMARQNVGNASIEVVHASGEKALQYITGKESVIVDPPRAGLHPNIIARLIETKPPTIVYLSCNPSTHARDVAHLIGAGYSIKHMEGFNFFPRTPHIENLIILQL